MDRIYQWTVLVVEDDPSQVLLFQRILEREGYVLQAAMSGNEAISLMKKLPQPAILIIDYELPDMNAKELLHEMKKENLERPFIITTAMGNEKIAVEMMKLGARDYIVKDSEIINILPVVVNNVVRSLNTERKLEKSQRELKEAQALFQSLVEELPIGIFLTRKDRINYVNPKFCQLTGYKKNELLNKKILNNNNGIIKLEKNEDLTSNQFHKCTCDHPENKHYKLNRKNHEELEVEIYTSQTHLDDLTYEINSIIDVTQKAEDEKTLYAAHRDIIWRLGRAAEFRDNETGMHIIRMSQYSALLAKEIGLCSCRCEKLLNASMLHDIGKIGIPDEILLKKDNLDEGEKYIMQKHVIIGANILSGSHHELLDMARIISLYHHENWDGSGYNEGLSGNEIPLEARICSICDVFDALTSSRPYKEPWSVQKAMNEIKKQKGIKFDPHLVEGFIKILPDVEYIKEIYSDDKHLSNVTMWT